MPTSMSGELFMALFGFLPALFHDMSLLFGREIEGNRQGFRIVRESVRHSDHRRARQQVATSLKYF